jgi:hypothetical protein
MAPLPNELTAPVYPGAAAAYHNDESLAPADPHGSQGFRADPRRHRPPHVPGQRRANAEAARQFQPIENMPVGIDCRPVAPMPFHGSITAAL